MIVALSGCGASGPVPAERPSNVATILSLAGQLQDGDLVFRRGRDAVSSIVLARQDGSRFSHVGMVLLQDGRPWVVHAMPAQDGNAGGVQQELLADFLSPAVASDAALYRMTGLDSQSRAKIRDWLQDRMGVPFDYAFSLASSDRMYCSELVAGALASTGQRPALPTVRVSLLDEPVLLPDALRHLPGMHPVGAH